jgi:hypothetical protein
VRQHSSNRVERRSPVALQVPDRDVSRSSKRWAPVLVGIGLLFGLVYRSFTILYLKTLFTKGRSGSSASLIRLATSPLTRESSNSSSAPKSRFWHSVFCLRFSSSERVAPFPGAGQPSSFCWSLTAGGPRDLWPRDHRFAPATSAKATAHSSGSALPDDFCGNRCDDLGRLHVPFETRESHFRPLKDVSLPPPFPPASDGTIVGGFFRREPAAGWTS